MIKYEDMSWYYGLLLAAGAGLVALVLFWPAVGGAQDVKKIDFTTIITNQDGEALKECAQAKDPPLQAECAVFTSITLGMLALRALTVQYPNESTVTGEDQIRRALLAEAIYKSASVTLDAKDTTLICDAIAKFVNKTGQNMLITLRAWQIIDPARVKK